MENKSNRCWTLNIGRRRRSELLGDILGINEDWWYPQKDVKEAVKELREKMYCDGFPDLNHKIMVDKLLKEIFGDELI